jgi:hypothetical protein
MHAEAHALKEIGQGSVIGMVTVVLHEVEPLVSSVVRRVVLLLNISLLSGSVSYFVIIRYILFAILLTIFCDVVV